MDETENGNARLDRYVAHINGERVPRVTATVLAWRGGDFLGVHDAGIPDSAKLFLTFFGLTAARTQDVHAESIGRFLNVIKADAYAFIDEAFVVGRPVGQPQGPPPSQDPNRSKIVLMQYEHASGPQIMRMYPLTKVDGVLVLENPNINTTKPNSSRYARLLTKYQHA